MDEAMVMKMLDHRNSDLPDRIKAALDLAEDFILNHADNVDDAFIERMRQYFTEEQLVELTVAIGTWDSVHKFNKVFDVDPPVEDGQLFTVGLPDVPKGMEQHLSCFVPDAVAADA